MTDCSSFSVFLVEWKTLTMSDSVTWMFCLQKQKQVSHDHCEVKNSVFVGLVCFSPFLYLSQVCKLSFVHFHTVKLFENVHKKGARTHTYRYSVPAARDNVKELHASPPLLLLLLSFYPFLARLLSLSFINFINRKIPLAPSLALPFRVNNFA